ncbi:peptidase S58 family protein [[Clostridium] bifermentans ATCC 638]|uniref:Peptidase S58 family protein n=1 Tax=Paraclostridium bifermentans ATCC 638 = DSM 14991 TaxID=1233171 RepID=T4VH66_PARBF|nr:P1 family peptidase [Paraclostridium bifermentans]EQK40460.1 peptidase S58 family protein [[Clostridium] bifermentans ATCC 638] [Paraclostridium bifermentans ATCC 638 = DSM 14991]RIZ58646.1 peptidase S58 family protein [Paraclostridium bifermentans]UAG18088.1 P1 family peptidase [Paraclostridium bifermentans]
MFNNILDVKGIKVGQVEDKEGLTGCTVIICEDGGVCGVDVRGSAPGTRETDLLDPINMVQKVHAIVLSGGSAFGLESTCGVSRYLEEKGIGFDVEVAKVPIVTGAVLFDLGVGDPKCRPNIEMGYKACQVANNIELKQGNYGAGCGATVGKIRGSEFCTKGGIGSYSIKLDNGLVVSAIIAVNAFGDVYENGQVIAGVLNDDKTDFLNTYDLMKKGVNKGGFNIDNTTIGAVITNAKLSKAECKKISQMAHNGFAKSIFPIHTPHDGDTIFTLATGEVETDITLLGSIASEVVEKSVINAIKNASKTNNILSYNEINLK